MKIGSISHKGLRRFIEDGDMRALPPERSKRLRHIIEALVLARGMGQVQGPPGWRIHKLSGDRADTWSISVSGNWRLTFDLRDGEINNLNLEDYH